MNADQILNTAIRYRDASTNSAQLVLLVLESLLAASDAGEIDIPEKLKGDPCLAADAARRTTYHVEQSFRLICQLVQMRDHQTDKEALQ